MITVTREIAEQEVSKWLDIKRVKSKKRDDMSDSIEALIDCFEDGTLRLNDEGELIQSLIFPITNPDGEVTVKELTYAPRVKVRSINNAMKNVKTGDYRGMVCGYIVALTGKVKGIIDSLDEDDYRVGQTISMFFL